MLILYGVAEVEALYFVLIVHTLQTILVVLLGVWAWIALALNKSCSITPNLTNDDKKLES